MDTRLNLVKKNINLENGHPFLIHITDVKELYNSRRMSGYHLDFYGTSIYGEKMIGHIHLEEIYFDVLVPEDMKVKDCVDDIRITGIETIRSETVQHYPMDGFHEHVRDYVRFYFDNSWLRNKAIRDVRNMKKYKTVFDCRNFYSIYTRENQFPLCGWVKIIDYDILRSFGQINHMFQINKFEPYVGEHIEEKSLVMAFDIESYNGRGTKEIPEGKFKKDRVFMISCTFHWTSDGIESENVDSICIVYPKMNKHEKFKSIICVSEQHVIETFAQVIENYCPDIILSFNGDRYDWKFLIDKCKEYDILEEFICTMTPKKMYKGYKNYWRSIYEREMKIVVGLLDIILVLNIPGIVNIDMRLLFQKTGADNNTLKGSLNFYLAKYGLSSKNEMTVDDMWKAFTEKDAELMKEVGWYCVIDSKRCFQLLQKCALYGFKKQIAAMSYTTLRDGINLKDSGKLRNLICSYAYKFNKVTSELSIHEEKINYGGGRVMEPTKLGLLNTYPCGTLDFKSLYPSIMITYNISRDTIIYTKKRKEELEEKGFTLREIEGMIDKKLVVGWTVWHNNDSKKYGVVVGLLKMLFDLRVATKGERKKHVKGSILYNVLDAKQLAIKIFMNTSYGDLGANISPSYCLLAAAAIAYTGQKLFIAAEKYALNEGYDVVYGDTDSIFPMLTEKVYDINGKSKEQIVKDCFYLLYGLAKKINIMFAEMTETNTIIIEVEHVYSNFLITCKKKYVGWAFESPTKKLNWETNPKNERDLDNGYLYVKNFCAKNQSKLDKIIFNNIMSEIIIGTKQREGINTNSMVEYIKEKIVYFYKKIDTLSVETFIRKGRYKAGVSKTSFGPKFKIRMDKRLLIEQSKSDGKPELYPKLTNGEVFEYIYTIKPYYTYKGTLSRAGMADKAEYPHIVEEYKMPINKDIYLTSAISMMSRVCCGANIFNDETDPGRFNNAKSYFEDFLNSMGNIDLNQGKILKDIWSSKHKSNKKTFQIKYNHDINSLKVNKNLYEVLYNYIIKSAKKGLKISNNVFLDHLKYFKTDINDFNKCKKCMQIIRDKTIRRINGKINRKIIDFIMKYRVDFKHFITNYSEFETIPVILEKYPEFKEFVDNDNITDKNIDAMNKFIILYNETLEDAKILHYHDELYKFIKIQMEEQYKRKPQISERDIIRGIKRNYN